ncbi:DNA cytosine methyltransferase [Niabella aurantiaca]|uniref:DNA cytosine methyltransferase n=1 Tax=Niabella aurantiaca TaxID=379900 RepID=UPI000368A6D1|nr:DNA (cytosine-5-)-methyltransferase [Niabella aurantiaca]
MRHAAFFNGIGCFQLAARNVGWDNVMSVEIDDWCNRLTSHHFPECRQHGDIKTVNFKDYDGAIDIISGGFPCQDISASGLGGGIYASRSGLWSEYARGIKEIHPGYILIENSPLLLKRGFEQVLYDLSEIGYNAEWEIISASDFGMPHIRKRLWVLAYPSSHRWKGILHSVKAGCIEKSVKADALDTQCHPFLRFQQGYSEPPIFRVDDGAPKRLDVVKRLGGCGNAVVRQIPEAIFSAINQYEKLYS